MTDDIYTQGYAPLGVRYVTIDAAELAALKARVERLEAAKLREQLAAYSHDAWSGWMRYQFSKAPVNPDGTWTMPAASVVRWHRQMDTDYADLPENERPSDRDEANKILAIVRAALAEPQP